MALSWEELSVRLAEPFPASAISWRAGSVSRDKKRAQALPYAEPRVYEDRLNEVLGPDWSCRFITWGDQRLLCELSVRVQDEAGEVREVTRTSTGEFDSGDRVAQGTAAEAQAFKRACSKFGLGRYLYDLPLTWVGYDEATRRLTERPGPGGAALVKTTPTLPERATPAPKLLDAPASAPAEATPTLSRGRAEAMGRELEKLGFLPQEQRRLAERVLGHRVADFSGLTEGEALEVWNVAKRSPPKAAQATQSPRAVGF